MGKQNTDRLYFLGLQNCYKWWLYEMVTMKLKEACSLEEKQWQILTAYWKAELTLLTKVCIVKAMVFPVVMYGCESWTIKKVEHRRTEAFELWCCRRLLTVPWSSLSMLKPSLWPTLFGWGWFPNYEASHPTIFLIPDLHVSILAIKAVHRENW